jgi:hypothetical protein
MFSGLLKYILVATSMAPVLLTFYGVKVVQTHCYKSGWQFLVAALILLCICLLLLRLSKKRLEILDINITSVKNADHNIISFLLVYLLPVLDIVKKDNVYVYGFILVVFFVIIINSNTYHFNPLLSLFGYKFYDITSDGNISYILITKQKILNTNDVKQVVHISTYMVLDIN